MKILNKKDGNNGSFIIEKNNKIIAELDYTIKDNVIDAYHTGVRQEFEGQGIAGMLFDELVKFAIDNGMKIIPTCSYILSKFKRDIDKFTNIWFKQDNEPIGESCGIKPKTTI